MDCEIYDKADARIRALRAFITDGRVKPEDLLEISELSQTIGGELRKLKAEAAKCLVDQGFLVKPGDTLSGLTIDNRIETITVLNRFTA